MFERRHGGAVFGLLMGFFADMSFPKTQCCSRRCSRCWAFSRAWRRTSFLNRKFWPYMAASLVAAADNGVFQLLGPVIFSGAGAGPLMKTAGLQVLWSLPVSALYLPHSGGKAVPEVRRRFRAKGQSMKKIIKTDRLVVLSALLVILLCVYFVFLYKLQIIQGADYAEKSANSIGTSQTVTAARGNILDSYGRVLVSNQPCYNITIDTTSELFDEKGSQRGHPEAGQFRQGSRRRPIRTRCRSRPAAV
jgi:uncharacterized membrane protein